MPDVALYDLTAGRRGAPPLWIGADGAFRDVEGPAPEGMAAATALLRAARWISTRRTLTFERLFPQSPFHAELAPTTALDEPMARGLLAQVRGALDAAAVGGAAAAESPVVAAQVRSAAVTVLSHMVATVRRVPAFRPHADIAAAWILEVIAREEGPDARPALRAHAIQLLQLRAPHLGAADKQRAAELVRGLVRPAPPYAALPGTWRFAMCSAWDFHEGECDVLRDRHGFTDVPDAAPIGDMPKRRYVVLRAPFATPAGDAIEVWARSASPSDENEEMGVEAFTGMLVNRHAQLGAFDMRASLTRVVQRGYKLMMNGQCAGLTTRFAISRLFPEADIYSSWDSTYFRTDATGKVSASEAVDCFVALLQGMSAGEDHARIEQRMKRVQWYHEQQGLPGFVQFVGPAHPMVVSRYSDVNHDGKADLYDGFLDFDLASIAEDVRGGMVPRDPGVAASQVGGEAARGLNWAAGSMNRVTQYSELWDGLPGRAELFYPFQSAGFYSHHEPPADLPPRAHLADPGLQPALSRYTLAPSTQAGISVEVMCHAWLAHTGMELKRLLVAADAVWAALDGGHLPATGALATREGQRGMVLLTLAGLLEFPADQNYVDALWSEALRALQFPDISRSVVRACINDADHDASNYYGSRRGLTQLLGTAEKPGALASADPVADARLRDPEPTIGRARALSL